MIWILEYDCTLNMYEHYDPQSEGRMPDSYAAITFRQKRQFPFIPQPGMCISLWPHDTLEGYDRYYRIQEAIWVDSISMWWVTFESASFVASLDATDEKNGFHPKRLLHRMEDFAEEKWILDYNLIIECQPENFMEPYIECFEQNGGKVGDGVLQDGEDEGVEE